MTMNSIADALASIPRDRQELDVADDLLRQVIHHVEHVLDALRPGMTTEFPVGAWVLAHRPANRRWIITSAPMTEPDNATPLLSAPRHVRAAAFRPLRNGLAPIEHLVIKVADNLAEETRDRSPMIEVAKRLTALLTEAGYPPPSSPSYSVVK